MPGSIDTDSTLELTAASDGQRGAPPAAPTPILVVVDGLASVPPGPAVSLLRAGLGQRFPGRPVQVAVTAWEAGDVVVRPLTEATGAIAARRAPPLTLGGVEASHSALGDVLAEAVRVSAGAVALVAAEPHDGALDWLGTFLSPILEGGFDFVSPAYLRHKADAAITTGIVYPLTRALYGRRLRQPLGGELAMSLALARRLLADPDWRRDPANAGSDAWLVAKVLASDVRACQAWLGAWPRPEGHTEDVSQTLARVLGLVFREMERNAERWQRVAGSTPMDSLGSPGFLEGGHQPPVERFVGAFQLGERELQPVWSLVLSPAARLALRRAAALPVERFRIDDTTWARVVYDFAVAHFARLVERRQLALSMTPLYLGWVASFAAETSSLDAAATEARVEGLCQAFEREKRYLISRWRWPDSFTP